MWPIVPPARPTAIDVVLTLPAHDPFDVEMSLETIDEDGPSY